MSDKPLPVFRVVLGLLLVMVIVPPASTQAQIGGSIGYGSSVFGTIVAAGGLLTYSFNGSTGDLVDAHTRNWTGTLDPQISLIAPDGQTLASSSTDPFSDDPLAAVVALVLPQTGIYSLRIGGDQGTTGDFVLSLHGRGAVPAQPLLPGQSVDVSIPPNPPSQRFSFEAQTCPTVLTVMNLSAGEPFTFPYYASVRNPQGTEIAQLMGGDALEDRLTVAPSSGRYEVQVSSLDPSAQGTIRLLVSCADQVPGCIPGGETATGQPVAGMSVCPSCFSAEFEAAPLCASFEIAVTLDEATATFTWPPVVGAQWYIFSIIDSALTLVADSAILLEGITSHTYTFNAADYDRGPFTAIVYAGNEIVGHLCIDDIPVEVDIPPGPEDMDEAEACGTLTVGADIVPGAVRTAVVHWSAAPGAAAYLIHVYAHNEVGDGLIGIRVLTVPGDATTYHLADLFPADYGQFQVKVDAYSEATGGGAFGDMPQGYLCSGSTDLEFQPLGPVEWGPGL